MSAADGVAGAARRLADALRGATRAAWRGGRPTSKSLPQNRADYSSSWCIWCGPLNYLVTWGYRLEPQSGSTLVTQYRQDHRPTWWVWVGSKQLLRISDPDTHYVTGMEATLAALANAAPA